MYKKYLCLALIAVLWLGAFPRALAESPLDSYATGNFGNQQTYAVYTGPGEEYFRANSGKAAYGGGSVRIYGITGDWILIGYGFGGGNYRIGYISKAALPAMNGVSGEVKQELNFTSTPAWADNYCRLTDDPVINNNMIYTIPEGTEVTVLAGMGTAWTYVEVQTPSGPMRGFVWSIHLVDASGHILAVTPSPVPTFRVYSWPTPYVPETPAPTATPIPTTFNTYYHDTLKGDWLPAYQEIGLQGDWPVYSGPGEGYYRANSGKALMGGGKCRVYGMEKDWILIGYVLSDGHYRFGYISAQALPQKGFRIPYLDVRFAIRRVAEDTPLTDDILRYYTDSVTTLPAGNDVIYLGMTEENGITWAYVEVLAENTIMRGFIPVSSLE